MNPRTLALLAGLVALSISEPQLNRLTLVVGFGILYGLLKLADGRKKFKSSAAAPSGEQVNHGVVDDLLIPMNVAKAKMPIILSTQITVVVLVGFFVYSFFADHGKISDVLTFDSLLFLITCPALLYTITRYRLRAFRQPDLGIHISPAGLKFWDRHLRSHIYSWNEMSPFEISENQGVSFYIQSGAQIFIPSGLYEKSDSELNSILTQARLRAVGNKR